MVEIEQWELRITARQGNARSPEAQELDLITCYLQLSKLMQPWQAVTKKQKKDKNPNEEFAMGAF